MSEEGFGPLEVDGGVGGLQVHLDDLARAGALLMAAAEPLWDLAASSGHLGGSIDLAQAALLCPGEAAGCEVDSLVLVNRAGAGAASMLELGRFLGQVVVEVQVADRLLAEAVDRGSFAAGRLLPGVAVVAAGATAGVLLATAPALAGVAASSSPQGLLARRVLIPRAMMTIGDARGVATRTLYDRPLVADAATRVLPGTVAAPLPVGRWADYRSTVAGLLVLSGAAGLLRDSGSSRVTRQGSARVQVPAGASLSTLATWQAGLTRHPPTPAGAPPPGARIRVLRLDPPRPGAAPSWIVQVPGTEHWSPTRGGAANDLATNLRQQARPDRPLLIERQVIEAMAAAGVDREGGAVMLTGHSQGGTTAMSLAGRAEVLARFDVRAVATFGSPAGAHDVPDGVDVLEVRNTADIVPRFDRGADRTDEHRIRVDAAPLDVAADHDDPLGAAHSIDSYAAIARSIDASDDPSLVAWRERTARFAGSGTSTIYDAAVVHDTARPQER